MLGIKGGGKRKCTHNLRGRFADAKIPYRAGVLIKSRVGDDGWSTLVMASDSNRMADIV
jgi:hypothetical protein